MHKYSCCVVFSYELSFKSKAKFLRTIPSAAQDDCPFPPDTFSLYKHYFVLTQLEEANAMYLFKKKRKATHPLHRLHSVSIGDRRKDCNNSDSLSHRMRGPIETAPEEILGLISVRECCVLLSLSFPMVRVTRAMYMFSPSFKLID